ncbi:hypothetical protein D4R51_01205 [bacterium]|nr:MAG: hypothetical protein D4R51_01205 [bacterium]
MSVERSTFPITIKIEITFRVRRPITKSILYANHIFVLAIVYRKDIGRNWIIKGATSGNNTRTDFPLLTCIMHQFPIANPVYLNLIFIKAIVINPIIKNGMIRITDICVGSVPFWIVSTNFNVGSHAIGMDGVKLA